MNQGRDECRECSPIAQRIKVIVGAGAFENSEPDEVALKRATVSVTVLLVKEARPVEGYDPRPCAHDTSRYKEHFIPKRVLARATNKLPVGL